MIRLFTDASRCLPREWTQWSVTVLYLNSSLRSFDSGERRAWLRARSPHFQTPNECRPVNSMFTSTTIFTKSPGITANGFRHSDFRTVQRSRSRKFVLDCASSAARIVLKPANATRTTVSTFQQRPLAVPMPITTVVPASSESMTTELELNATVLLWNSFKMSPARMVCQQT